MSGYVERYMSVRLAQESRRSEAAVAAASRAPAAAVAAARRRDLIEEDDHEYFIKPMQQAEIYKRQQELHEHRTNPDVRSERKERDEASAA